MRLSITCTQSTASLSANTNLENHSLSTFLLILTILFFENFANQVSTCVQTQLRTKRRPMEG
jgi:hypothetical protein